MTDDRSTALDVPQVVRVMQIICLALAAGPIVFAVLTVTVLERQEDDPNGLLTLIGYGFGAVTFMASLIVGPAVRNAAVRQAAAGGTATPGNLAGAYQVGLIVASAICEGGAFFNIIAYFLEGTPWSLAAAATLIAVNLLRFPTLGRVNDWIESTLRRLRDERSFTSG